VQRQCLFCTPQTTCIVAWAKQTHIPTSPHPAHLQTSMKLRPMLLRAFIIVVTVCDPPINSYAITQLICDSICERISNTCGTAWLTCVWPRMVSPGEIQMMWSAAHMIERGLSMLQLLFERYACINICTIRSNHILGLMFSKCIPVRFIQSPATSASLTVPHTCAR